MNKKIIAIAIAAAMAAPVAMAADMKVSGRINAQFGSVDATGDADVMGRLNDSGQGRLQFDVKDGDAYARFALDTRYGRDRNDTNITVDLAPGVLPEDVVTSAGKSDWARTNRDSYVGYNFSGVKVQYGRMAGAAKNIEKDPYIATFLQLRNNTISEAATAANMGSSSFVDDVFQVSTKVGGAKVTVQANFDDNSGSTSSKNEGHVAIAVTGKAGPVNYWLSTNNGTADATVGNDQTNTKIGASMKFGTVKVSLNLTNSDDNGAENDSTLVMADMGLGNGLSANVGFASNKASDTWMRLAITKKLSKTSSVYAGYTADDYDAGGDKTTIGAGMTVKF